jgi:hypothetical protein
MQERYGDPNVVRRETNTQFRVGTDRIVGRRIIVGFVRDHAQPKPAAFIASLCKISVRTAERYVSGEIDFPPEVYIWAMQKLHEREGAGNGSEALRQVDTRT